MVEDNPIDQKVAVHQLDALRLQAGVVGSGKEALEMADAVTGARE